MLPTLTCTSQILSSVFFRRSVSFFSKNVNTTSVATVCTSRSFFSWPFIHRGFEKEMTVREALKILNLGCSEANADKVSILVNFFDQVLDQVSILVSNRGDRWGSWTLAGPKVTPGGFLAYHVVNRGERDAVWRKQAPFCWRWYTFHFSLDFPKQQFLLLIIILIFLSRFVTRTESYFWATTLIEVVQTT